MADPVSSAFETIQLRAITEAMTVYLDRGDVGAASQPLLAGAFELTDSEYGFVGVVAEETDGAVLRVLAHRGIVWHQTENRDFYEAALRRYAEVGYLEFRNFDTLFGRVLRSGRPLIANDAANHPDAAGVPPGHPPLCSFLGVPFLWGDEVVGMIGVANRLGGYRREEQGRLEGLANAAGVLFDSYRRRERHAVVEAARARAEAQLRESNRRLAQALGELEAAQERVVREERLRAVGLMASGIAHDFNNSLQAIAGYANYLLERPAAREDPKELVECLETIRIAARDAERVVDRLGAFYRKRAEDAALGPVEIERLLEEVIALTRPRWHDEALAEGRLVSVATEQEETPIVIGDAHGLREALTNLVFNAVDALPSGGHIVLRCAMREGRLCLEVADDGAGMPPEVRERCLEPFFSTKDVPRTGMGLAMVWGVVHRHGGDVEIESEPGRGTRVRLLLPLAPARVACETDAEAAFLASGESAPRPLRVLVVDDEPAIRSALARLLRADGHHVELLADGAAALDRLKGAGAVDVVVADQAMPGLTGLELARRLGQDPAAPRVVLLSGFADRLEGEAAQAPAIAAVLKKPVSAGALRSAIHRAAR